MEQAEDTVVNASIPLPDMWDGDNSKDAKAHERSKLTGNDLLDIGASNEAIAKEDELDSKEEAGPITDDTETISETTHPDDIDEEIEKVENEVEEVEYNSYPGECDAENQI